MGQRPKPVKAKAKVPVAPKSPKNRGAQVRDLEKRLAEALKDRAEALEQRTASSEILRVISSSPTDIQPVFDAIAAKALDLCRATTGWVYTFDGELIHVAAAHGLSREGIEARRQSYPMPPSRSGGTSRAVLSRTIIYIPDIREDHEYTLQPLAKAAAYLSVLAVPMLREGKPIGVITVTGAEAGAFSQRQIELLETFADQAVIAIENVRLFTELQDKNRALTEAHGQVTEALEQQTATGEILRAISSSPTDAQPVFEAIVRSAVRLCNARFANVFRLEGDLVHLVAHHNVPFEALEHFRRTFPQPLSQGGTLTAQAMRQGTVVHIHDVEAQSDVATPVRALTRSAGYRSVLAVPILRPGNVVGAIGVGRSDVTGAPWPFSDKEVALLQIFADQAVIAIENVRLFSELQASNRELTTALDTQTATSDILRVMSHAQTDVQPVFDAILASAVRLLQGYSGVVTRVAGDQLDLAALTRTTDAGDAAVRALYPERLDSQATHVRATRNRAPLNIADAHSDPQLPEVEHTRARVRGYRSHVVVPLLRQDEAIGTIGVTRRDPGGFTDDEIALLQTFADQAVIAIENVRLFKELEASNREIAEKSRQIEVASQHKSEFLANMSHELRTPLNAIIGFSEVLSDRMFGDLNEKQEEYLKDIYASGNHLLSLINDILDLSKIEAGRMELELTDFHLPTALDNALTLVRERAGRRSIALQMSVDERLGEVRADERKIRQVVLNLLSNAIKFTPEGGRIEVLAAPKDGLVEVSVSDTGVGIAPADQEAVFEEFRQVGTADKKAEGTGLGLTLCRKFIELHGGRIWVKSQVGVGSTFTFNIPVRHGE